MTVLRFILKLLLKIAVAPVILALSIFVWLCAGIVYVSGLVLGIINMVIAVLGVAVLIMYSPQNGIGVFDKSLQFANGSVLAAGEGAEPKVCHPGFGILLTVLCD